MPDGTDLQKAQLVKLVQPAFLSMVKSPSNRTGFKVIRSAQGDIAPDVKRNFRTRLKSRNDGSLLSIDLPPGITEDEAIAMMDAFSMAADYEVMRDENDELYLKRKDSDGLAETIAIDLGEGYIANVEASSFATRSEDDKTITGVTLVGLELDGFEKDEALAWLEDREINFNLESMEVFDGGVIVTRHEVPEGNEVRKLRIATGVTGLVARTEETDVPAKVYRSVIEQSYGQWGWGHLNFAMALADVEFTDGSWDAISTLRDILENIIIYSGLPLDERKTLVQNATGQFNSYIVSLIDSLPREVIEQAKAERKQQENIEMADSKDKSTSEKAPESKAADSVTDENTETETRAEDETVTEVKTEDKVDPLTRDEVVGLVAEAVTVAIRELMPEKDTQEAKRSEDNAEEGKTSDVESEVLKAIRELNETVTSLKGEVDELAGTTVTRSDMDDASEDEGAEHRDANVSPFRGMFAGGFGKKSG